MNTENCCRPDLATKGVCGGHCMKWTPIVVGALIATGLSFLLGLFSVAIGLSIYTVDASGGNHLAVGGMLAFAIGIIVVMFFSGWIAGALGKSSCVEKCCGGIYGLTTWCLALVLSIALAMPTARYISNYTSYLANTVATSAVENVTPNAPAPAAAPSQDTTNELSKGAFVIFLMFFLGALSATCGGHLGATCCCKEKHL